MDFVLDYITNIQNYFDYNNVNNNKSKYQNKKNIYSDKFEFISSKDIDVLRQNYKIIDVEWLDPVKVNYKIFEDNYFDSNPNKKQVDQDILDYYLSHKDKHIYEKTDYLCNSKEKICICNTHAHDFRKIYDGNNYNSENNFISWIDKKIKK